MSFNAGDRVQLKEGTFALVGTITEMPSNGKIGVSVLWDGNNVSNVVYSRNLSLAPNLLALASSANEALIAYRDALDNIRPAKDLGQNLFAAVDALTGAIIEEANR